MHTQRTNGQCLERHFASRNRDSDAESESPRVLPLDPTLLINVQLTLGDESQQHLTQSLSRKICIQGEFPSRSSKIQKSLDRTPFSEQSSPKDIMAHALIFGASGISGWSLLNQTRVYPTPTTFERITGTTSRPFSLEQAQIPQDERIKIASGVDLTKSASEVAATLKEKVDDISSVTHVFFTGKLLLTALSTLTDGVQHTYKKMISRR